MFSTRKKGKKGEEEGEEGQENAAAAAANDPDQPCTSASLNTTATGSQAKPKAKKTSKKKAANDSADLNPDQISLFDANHPGSVDAPAAGGDSADQSLNNSNTKTAKGTKKTTPKTSKKKKKGEQDEDDANNQLSTIMTPDKPEPRNMTVRDGKVVVKISTPTVSLPPDSRYLQLREEQRIQARARLKRIVDRLYPDYTDEDLVDLIGDAYPNLFNFDE